MHQLMALAEDKPGWMEFVRTAVNAVQLVCEVQLVDVRIVWRHNRHKTRVRFSAPCIRD